VHPRALFVVECGGGIGWVLCCSGWWCIYIYNIYKQAHVHYKMDIGMCAPA
jgi:hypothetical protein